MMYFILLPHLPALFVTSLIDCWVQTGGTFDCIVFCHFQTYDFVEQDEKSSELCCVHVFISFCHWNLWCFFGLVSL